MVIYLGMVILNKKTKKEKGSKMNKEQMKKLVEQTKKVSAKRSLQNNMSVGAKIDNICEILIASPRGLKPKELADKLTEQLSPEQKKKQLIVEPKATRGVFQKLGLKGGAESDIVIDRGNFAYVVTLTKVGGQNLYSAVKKS